MEKKDQFIQKIQDLFGQKHARILHHLYSRPPKTFRVNTMKVPIQEAISKLKLQGFKILPGPIENSFIVDHSPKGKSITETEIFNEGKIYIQSLSSMVPVIMLEPQPGENILDLCAAPGSKTTQMAQISNLKSHIVAVDNNKNRIYRLEDNLKLQGVDNVQVIYANGAGLDRKFRNFVGFFDKILVDAPCSNEGLICLSDPSSFEYWNPRLPKKLSRLQKKLVASAVRMLKPGGTLVYSTCTFSREENEEIVIWTLNKFKDMTLSEVKKVLPDGTFTAFFAAKLVKRS